MTLRVGKMASILYSSHLIGFATHAGLRQAQVCKETPIFLKMQRGMGS